jgi:hypothetical protein
MKKGAKSEKTKEKEFKIAIKDVEKAAANARIELIDFIRNIPEKCHTCRDYGSCMGVDIYDLAQATVQTEDNLKEEKMAAFYRIYG